MGDAQGAGVPPHPPPPPPPAGGVKEPLAQVTTLRLLSSRQSVTPRIGSKPKYSIVFHSYAAATYEIS